VEVEPLEVAYEETARLNQRLTSKQS
jgi:hypothetical protein